MYCLQILYVTKASFSNPERAKLEELLEAIPIDFNNNDMVATAAIYWEDAIFMPPGPANMEGRDGSGYGLIDCIYHHHYMVCTYIP